MNTLNNVEAIVNNIPADVLASVEQMIGSPVVESALYRQRTPEVNARADALKSAEQVVNEIVTLLKDPNISAENERMAMYYVHGTIQPVCYFYTDGTLAVIKLKEADKELVKNLIESFSADQTLCDTGEFVGEVFKSKYGTYDPVNGTISVLTSHNDMVDARDTSIHSAKLLTKILDNDPELKARYESYVTTLN